MNQVTTGIPSWSVRKVFPSAADAFKISASYIIGATAVLYCLYVAFTEGEKHHLQGLLCVLGGVLGWIVGLYLTPDSEGEKKRFSEAGKVLAALGAGFGIGKADEILLWLKPWVTTGSQDLVTLRLAIFTCCFLIAALFTYISRLHVRDDAEALGKKREKALVEAQEALNKLVRLN